ncbi:MAG TPA: outer membrane protein assembly factor BamA [Rubrivivax sp.]|nr:outer membrane protein assembly factor BamA [Rubrivivax sp.]
MFPVPRSSLATSVLRLLAACLLLAAALYAPAAQAVQPFVVRDIRLEGLQRTDPGTVFGALPFRIGDTYTDEKGATALRALFATGLFKDVRIEIEDQIVVVVIDERAIIATVSFVGLKEFEKDVLLKSLREAGIGEGLPFDKALVDRAEQEIKRQYLSRSLYGAEVVTTVTPIERNRVNVTFTMTEGDAARIREIRIVGATAFTESTLLSQFEVSPSGWLSWYTKGDRYSRAKLNADLETLRAWYLNRGFLEFAIDSTQVTISPDKQDISVTITIREGQVFTVTGVRLEGEFLGREDEFRALVSVVPGQPYRGDEVATTVRRMSELFAIYGFAFARVEPRPEVDRSAGQVLVVFAAEPQRRVYVRRIDVAGNTRTRDEVVRREFRQLEASWYDGAKIRLSKERLDRLGYFGEVSIDTVEVSGTPDQVDLLITVVEKATGNLSIGAGYSSAEGLTLTGSIRQDNVFGSGHFLGLEINTGKVARTVALNTVDPYWTVDGISRGFDAYYRASSPLNTFGDSYQIATWGFGTRIGVPFTEIDTVFFGLGYEQTQIGDDAFLPNSYFLYREQFGASSNSFPLTVGWSRDARNSTIFPTQGRYYRANSDLSLFGDVQFLRLNLQAQQYMELPYNLTLGLNGEVGWGFGLGSRPYPVFKNFYSGGLGSVRVFEQSSLGTVDPTGAFIGGTRKMNANAELYIPVPGMGNDKSLRFFAFFDIGNAWGPDQSVTFGSLRASTGLGISWVSPLGPLKISYGTPVLYEGTDRIQPFQFQIGTRF